MAHHLAHRSAYQRLTDRLNRFPQGAPPSESLFAIQKLLFSEREAALVAALPIRPFRAEKAAEIWKVPLAEARRTLDALAAPKVHHQGLPDRILAEPWALDAATAAALRARGHAIETRARPFGNPQAVMIDPATGWRLGASDPRWDGAAATP